MRFPSFFTFFLVLALFVSGCKKDQDVVAPDALFGKDWYNTRQQDASGAYTYKLQGSFTPVGWGIDGFRFEKDGGFTLYTQGPADGALSIACTWTTEDSQTFHIKPNDPQYAEFNILIYSVSASSLKARRNP